MMFAESVRVILLPAEPDTDLRVVWRKTGRAVCLQDAIYALTVALHWPEGCGVAVRACGRTLWGIV